MRKPLSLLTTGLAAGALLLTGASYASAGAEADPATSAASTAEPYKVLVVGETLGFRHSHIDDTTHAVIDLGEENGFTVDVWDPPGSSPGQPALTLASSPFTTAATCRSTRRSSSPRRSTRPTTSTPTGRACSTTPSSPRSRATSAAAAATSACTPRPTRCTRCPGTAS